VLAAENLIRTDFAHERYLSIVTIDVLLDVLQQIRNLGELAATKRARKVSEIDVGLYMF